MTSPATHLIVGAGAAGLSLAWRLTRHPATAGQPIVLLDADAKRANDRTWSFWERTDRPGLFPELVSAEWRTAEVRTATEQLVLPLAPYAYRTIRGADFYDFMRRHLLALPHVRWEQATVTEVRDEPAGATAHAADGRTFHGAWLYDSRFRFAEVPRRPDKYFYLAQHFVGWFVETTRDVFRPDVATLFDFRTPQYGEMRFVYVLPTGPCRALVEFTLFTENLLTREAYDAGMAHYMHEVLGLRPDEYRITDTEAGVIPMTDHPLPMRGGRHIVNIGSRGGASKPSTGFTFRRIQHQTAAIVQALARTGQPWAAEPTLKRRFQLYDAMMLDLLARRGELAAPVFTQLFRRNPVARMLRFLDDDTHFGEELAVMASVPPFPFLAALGRQAGRALK